jgi:hypothetical protein
MPPSFRAVRSELVPLGICVCLGLTMALLPPLVCWPRVGQPVCIGDPDEIYYLGVGSQAYFNHLTYLGDPSRSDGLVNAYPRLPMLPGVVISRMLGLGVMGIDLVWRFVAGLSISLGWYILARHYIKRPWVVVSMVSILLADGGMLGSSLLIRQAINMIKVVSGRPGDLFEAAPLIHREWRISTPALTMAFLLMHVWLMARARMQPTWPRLVLSGLSFGLLFYVYPYYWTAASLALLIALAIDAGHRRVYFWTGFFGGLMGLPQVIAHMIMKQSGPADWLIRSGKLISQPRLAGLSIPITASIVALIGIYWVWTRRRDLTYVWALGSSGLMLYNHQIITGLSIENYHWVYVWGPCLSFLLVLLVESLLPQHGRWARPALGLLLSIAIADVATGIALRVAETLRNTQTQNLLEVYRRFRDQRLIGETAELASNAIVAGVEPFVNHCAILENVRPLDNYWTFLSPSVTDEEWNRRKALNVYLLDPSAGEGELRRRLTGINWGGKPSDEERRISERLAVFRTIERELDSNLDRYAVRYVALPAEQSAPNYLKQGWVCLQKGPYWQLWERRR